MGKEKKYTITVTENPEFCGIGAAGIQFAHGKAETASERAAAWHREHRGYAVEETDTAEKNKDKKQKPKK